MSRQSTAGATELLAKAVKIIAPSTLATTTDSLEILPRLPASRATLLERMRWSRHAGGLRRQPSRSREPAMVLKDFSQLART
jgi:hypothetical protein